MNVYLPDFNVVSLKSSQKRVILKENFNKSKELTLQQNNCAQKFGQNFLIFDLLGSAFNRMEKKLFTVIVNPNNLAKSFFVIVQ